MPAVMRVFNVGLAPYSVGLYLRRKRSTQPMEKRAEGWPQEEQARIKHSSP